MRDVPLWANGNLHLYTQTLQSDFTLQGPNNFKLLCYDYYKDISMTERRSIEMQLAVTLLVSLLSPSGVCPIGAACTLLLDISKHHSSVPHVQSLFNVVSTPIEHLYYTFNYPNIQLALHSQN